MKRTDTILIYRLGSLGDTVVALPTLHLIASAFPNAKRWVLTNFSISTKAPSMAQVLDKTGLVNGYLEYPIGLRDPRAFFRLRQKIRRLRPDILVYLNRPRGLLKAYRDIAFFLLCGIHRLVGVPFTNVCQRPWQQADGLYEYEGARLLRCVASLGGAELSSPKSFDLYLRNDERLAIQDLLKPLAASRPLIGTSIGAKVDVKDWGDANWAALLTRIGAQYPNAGLVMLGAKEEQGRSDALLQNWPGMKLNLCGRLNVRKSAAVLERTGLFVGHDSGPMHLSAAVGTPCVAIFSSRNYPGEWFPYGTGHCVLYRPMPCQGCRKDTCPEYDKACIRSISVERVADCIQSILDEPTAHQANTR